MGILDRIQKTLGIDARSRLDRLHRAGARSQRIPSDWQFCSVYQRENGFVIVCGSRRVSGVIDEGGPFRTFPASSDADALGAAILEVMTHSRTGLPDRADGAPEPPAWWKSAGYRSWKAFAASTRCVGVSRGDGTIRMYATDGDARGAFIHRPIEQHRACVPKARPVGETALELLGASTPVFAKKS